MAVIKADANPTYQAQIRKLAPDDGSAPMLDLVDIATKELLNNTKALLNAIGDAGLWEEAGSYLKPKSGYSSDIAIDTTIFNMSGDMIMHVGDATELVALGQGAGSERANNIAIGDHAGADGTDAQYTDNITIGLNALRGARRQRNIAIGVEAAYYAASSQAFTDCIAIGYQSMNHTAYGSGMIAIGNYSEGGSWGVTIGHGARIGGYAGVSVGYQSQISGSGDQRVNVGYRSGYGATGGSCTVVGYEAGYNNTSWNLQGFGRAALKNGSGWYAIAIGSYAGQSSSAMQYSIAIGNYAMASSSCEYSVGIGSQSLQWGSGNNNVGVGYRALNEVDGTGNVAIGYDAGRLLSGSNQLIIENSGDIVTPLIHGHFTSHWLKINGDLRAEAGILTLKHITTPANESGYGKLYAKSDNKLYFRDAGGTEHEVAFV